MGICLQSRGLNDDHTTGLHLPRWPDFLLGSLLSSKHCIPSEKIYHHLQDFKTKM